MWFTTPPVDVVRSNQSGLGHSVSFIAKRERMKKLREEYQKRKAEEAEAAAKKQRKLEAEAREGSRLNAMTRGLKELEAADETWWEARFGDKWAGMKALGKQFEERQAKQ